MGWGCQTRAFPIGFRLTLHRISHGVNTPYRSDCRSGYLRRREQPIERMKSPWRFRTLGLAAKAFVPTLLTGRRTNAGVAAYFDLITPEALAFYGEDFHFGYFPTGEETLEQALRSEEHTSELQ